MINRRCIKGRQQYSRHQANLESKSVGISSGSLADHIRRKNVCVVLQLFLHYSVLRVTPIISNQIMYLGSWLQSEDLVCLRGSLLKWSAHCDLSISTSTEGITIGRSQGQVEFKNLNVQLQSLFKEILRKSTIDPQSLKKNQRRRWSVSTPSSDRLPNVGKIKCA